MNRFFLAPLLLASVSIQAQDSLQLDQITVHDKKVESTEQEQSATSDAAQLLLKTPGLTIYGAGGISTLPVLRGLADDRINIQVDGIETTSSCPNHMNP